MVTLLSLPSSPPCGGAAGTCSAPSSRTRFSAPCWSRASTSLGLPARSRRRDARLLVVHAGVAVHAVSAAVQARRGRRAGRRGRGVPRSPVQRVFTTRVSLYLGRISFALFLAHKLVIRIVGDRLLARCQQILGVTVAGEEHQHGGVEQDELEDRHARGGDGDGGGDTTDNWAYAASFVLATAMVYQLAIWTADVFWRAVEMPSMTLARWAEHKSTLPRPAPPEPRE